MTPWTLIECCSSVMHTHVVLLELELLGGGINMDVLTCRSRHLLQSAPVKLTG